MSRPRFLALAGLALAVLAAGNWWLNRERRPEPPPVDPVAEHIDYALDDFHATFFDQHGTPTLDLSGPRLTHDARTRIAHIESPDFVIRQGPAEWRGSAARARGEREPRVLELEGNVHVERPHPNGRIVIESAMLRYDRAASTLHSPATAHLRQGGNELVGGTLTAWIDDERMELSNDVHAIYRGGVSGSDDRRRRGTDDRD